MKGRCNVVQGKRLGFEYSGIAAGNRRDSDGLRWRGHCNLTAETNQGQMHVSLVVRRSGTLGASWTMKRAWSMCDSIQWMTSALAPSVINWKWRFQMEHSGTSYKLAHGVWPAQCTCKLNIQRMRNTSGCAMPLDPERACAKRHTQGLKSITMQSPAPQSHITG